jgi:hypothetical protein
MKFERQRPGPAYGRDVANRTSFDEQNETARLELQARLNVVHVPRDAGEHEAGLRLILARIPDKWGRWISCGRGWYPLIVDLDRALAEIDPYYQVLQVKQKLGGLRYYFELRDQPDPADPDPESRQARADVLVQAAEKRAAHTCERCGNPGTLSRSKAPDAWYQTMCDDCAQTKDYQPVASTTRHCSK